MEALINNLRQSLKRRKVDNAPGDSGGVRPKRERLWYNKEKGDPVCIFCEGKHRGDACEVVNTNEEDSSSKKGNCVSAVAAQDTGGNIGEAETVSSASQSII